VLTRQFHLISGASTLGETELSLVTHPIVVVGSINMDLVCAAERLPLPGETIIGSQYGTFSGGKGANQAVAIARLGYPSFMVGKLGRDASGQQLRRSLVEAGVDVSHVSAGSATSGTALITTDNTGQNTIVVIPGANAELSPLDIDRASGLIARAALVLTQLEIPLPTVVHLGRVCAQHGVPLMLDPAPACSLPRELLAQLAWLTPNETEAGQLLGSSRSFETDLARAEHLLQLGPRGVVLKQGPRGALLATQDGLHCSMTAFAVPVVDATAAGDAFNAGFAVGLLRGESACEALRYATAAATLSVTRRGAQSSMPHAEEVRSLLEKNADQQQKTSATEERGS
jgi:ribokinase